MNNAVLGGKIMKDFAALRAKSYKKDFAALRAKPYNYLT